MRNILLSLLSVSALVVVVAAGSTAFFTDTETSNGNVLGASSLDMEIRSMGSDIPGFGWGSLTNNETLYELSDLQPGDTRSVELRFRANQNIYVCSQAEITAEGENFRTETEQLVDSTGGTNSGGELQNYLSMKVDDYEIGVLDFVNAGWVGIQDPDDDDLVSGSYLPASTVGSLTIEYCFGDYNESGDCETSGEAGDYDDAQTDYVEGTIRFQAVQADNNPSFDCTDLNSTT